MHARTIFVVIALMAFTVSVEAQKLLVGQAGHVPDRRFEHVKLQLRTIVDSTQKTDKTQFRPNDDVAVQVLATNSGSTQVSLVYWKSSISYLPKLSKAGEIVPYSKAMEKRLTDVKAREKRASTPASLVRDSAIIARLAPNQMSEAALLSLSYYYDKLQPGIYQLKVKFRERSGLTLESDTTMFEVLN